MFLCQWSRCYWKARFRHLYSSKIYSRKISECLLHPCIIHLSDWTLPAYAYYLATFVLFHCFSMPLYSLTATVCLMTSCLCDNHHEGLACNSKTVSFCLFAQQAYRCTTSELSNSMDYGSLASSYCYPPPLNQISSQLTDSSLFVSTKRPKTKLTLNFLVEECGDRTEERYLKTRIEKYDAP